MKKIFLLSTLIIISLLFTTQKSIAIPAYPHPLTVNLPNGTQISVQIYGDEFFSYTLTLDGYQVERDNDGYFYYFDNNAQTRNSAPVRASSPSDRDENEKRYVSTLSTGVDQNYLELGKQAALIKRQYLQQLNMSKSVAQAPYSLNAKLASDLPLKGLVILAQYSDVKFKDAHTKATFENLLNQKGYSHNGAIGSAKDYFTDNSLGKYNIEFVVSSIVTLPNSMAYYGARSGSSNDIRPAQMIRDACEAADAEINFAEFATINPKYVDNVFVFYAGYNEAEGGSSNSIWPHRWIVHSSNTTGNRVFDGVELWDYACTSELRGTQGSTLAGIGTFVHEFGHVLGLPDFYDTDYNGSGGYTVGLYDISVMSGGAYNSNGNKPPYYSGIERNIVGWNSLKTLKSSNGTLKIDPINTQEGNDIWIIETSTKNEFFCLESRSSEKWDADLNSTGLLIYHIDYSNNNSGNDDKYGAQLAKDRWNTNTINTNPTHPCARFVESSGVSNNHNLNPKAVMYPGNNNRTTFTVDDYGYSDWSGNPLLTSLTDITNSNGVVTLIATANENPVITFGQREANIAFRLTGGATNWNLKIKPRSSASWSQVIENIATKEYLVSKLEPNTEYLVEITTNNASDGAVESSFKTEALTSNYAYISGISTNVISGVKYDISVKNIQQAPKSVKWLINGTVAANGISTFNSTGTQLIECVITYENGDTESIKRTVNATKN